MKIVSRVAAMAVLTLLAICFAGKTALAQDPVKVGPGIYKTILENDYVRVCEVTFKPGAKMPMHSHPGHVIYWATDGKLNVTTPDGKTVELDGKAGDAMWSPPVTHAGENIGTADVKLIVTEIKSVKTAAPAKKAEATKKAEGGKTK